MENPENQAAIPWFVASGRDLIECKPRSAFCLIDPELIILQLYWESKSVDYELKQEKGL